MQWEQETPAKNSNAESNCLISSWYTDLHWHNLSDHGNVLRELHLTEIWIFIKQTSALVLISPCPLHCLCCGWFTFQSRSVKWVGQIAPQQCQCLSMGYNLMLACLTATCMTAVIWAESYLLPLFLFPSSIFPVYSSQPRNVSFFGYTPPPEHRFPMHHHRAKHWVDNGHS